MFDVIVGNPPFQETSESNSKKWSSNASSDRLWMKFVRKSIEIVKDNGYVTLIIPSGWIGSTSETRNLLKKYNIIFVNLSKEVKSMFDAGGTMNFTYFLLRKENPINLPIFRFDNNIEKSIDILNMPVNPVKSSNFYDFSIMEKILKSGINSFHWERRDKYKNTGKIEAILPKIKTSINSYVSDSGGEDQVYAYSTDREKAENIVYNLNQKLYKRLTWIIRPGMVIGSNIRFLPIPSDKKYSNEELYDLYKLSPEEREYINSFNYKS